MESDAPLDVAELLELEVFVLIRHARVGAQLLL